MAVECKCEACGSLLKIDAAPGAGVDCPQCKASLEVPEPAAEGAEVPVARVVDDDEVIGRIDWRDVAQRSVPWAASIAVHGVLLIILGLIAWASISDDSDRRRMMTPSMETAEAGGTLNPGPTDDPLQPARTQDEVLLPDQHDDLLSANPLDDPLQAINTTAQTTSQLTSALTQGPVTSAAPIGQLWQVDAGSRRGPPSRFMGSGGQAHNICYVIDRSGSMITAFGYVQREMLRSIKELQPGQMFHVIFFSRGEPEEMSGKGLVRADDLNKAEAIRFINGMVEAGQTDPRPALRRAFALRPRPQLIYFLTDGSFSPEVLEELRQWNADKQTQVNTIAFLNRSGEGLLRQIAQENNGEYLFVNPEGGISP